jgi:hypothetical protein
MSGEVEAALVRQLERRHRRIADLAEAYAPAVAEAPNLRGAAAAWRGAADRAAAELAEARAELARAQRPEHVAVTDVRAGMFLWNRYGGQRGRFTAAADARMMPDGTVEIDAADGRTARFRPGSRLDIDWHAADLAAQLAAETEAREAAGNADREAGK